jgi:phage shock protein PspC (stress-responsive transcriptional regulator)
MGKLKRSEDDKWIAGVCGGLAKEFKMDPMLIRILWIAGTLFTGVVWGVIIYIALIFVMDQT